MKLCEDCREAGRPVHSRRLCNRCYQRRWKAGTIVEKTYRRPTEEYFFEKVDTSGPCWEWTGSLDRQGYGRFSVRGEMTYQAHRWCWTHLTGMSLDGLELNHSCRNKACVNPDHLEPMTRDMHHAQTMWELHGIGEKPSGLSAKGGMFPEWPKFLDR